MWLFFAAAAFASLVGAQCPTGQKTAVGGVWSDPAAWCPPGVPAENSNVEIPAEVDILLDVSTPRLGWVVIQAGGKLRFDNGKGATDVELLFQAETILNKGYLEMGRELIPLTRPVRVLLLALSTPPPRAADLELTDLLSPPYGQKMLAVAGSGIWEAHGAGRQVMWTKLSMTVDAGASSISLIEPVDWKVGDEIIICSTDFSPSETERRFITSVSADRRVVGVSSPLLYGHYGVSKMYAGFPVDMRGEVGVLTSNFVIEGDMINSPTFTPETFVEQNNLTQYIMYGGHTVSVEKSFVRLSGIQFKAMGQGGRLARYPVHWHHRGDAPGQYIKRCSIHDSFSRSITVHDTKQLLIEETVSFNVLGHAIYLEDGTEELNQFYNNLVVTSLKVGKDSQDVFTGSWKFPECGTVQPGLRLQYLDYQPSGFWITSANNTFVGNVAVGHNWGFWIRVDFVFSEPLFPGGCTVCCPDGGRDCNCTAYWRDRYHYEREIDIASSGLVFVDNVAHSNIEGGWWIKENWQPQRTSSNLIDGFLSYKNLVGVDNYGIANLNFTRIIVADNAGGAHIDWVRFDSSVFSNSLFLGESDNHGNPYHNTQESSKQMAGTATASLVYPGFNRTYSSGMSNLGQYCLRMGDQYHHLNDIVFMNCRRPNSQWSSKPYLDDYSGQNYVGSLTFHLKDSWAGPDRELKGLYWVNSDPVSRMRGSKLSSSIKNDTTIPAYRLPSGSCHEYGAGFVDVDGSFPCSQPGAWWLSNNPAMVPPECEYRNASNMFYCPPGPYAYRQLKVTAINAYANSGWMSGSIPVLTWECGKVLFPNSDQNYHQRFSVHTKKNYVLSMVRSDGRTEVLESELGSTVGMTFEFSRWDVYEGMDFVVRINGAWSGSYFLRQNDGNNPLLVAAPSTYLQTACSCGVTYAKITTKGYKDGPWPGPRSPDDNATTYYPERGWELHFTKNASAACAPTPSCTNPFAAPTPANCATPNVVNNAHPSTCAVRPPPSTPRVWVTRPAIKVLPVPSEYVFPAYPPGVSVSASSKAEISMLCACVAMLFHAIS